MKGRALLLALALLCARPALSAVLIPMDMKQADHL